MGRELRWGQASVGRGHQGPRTTAGALFGWDQTSAAQTSAGVDSSARRPQVAETSGALYLRPGGILT
eukprot:9487740-Pyramimonas_sp.AAC.1